MSQPPFDMSKIAEQAKQLQERVQRIQETLRHREAEATVGGGMVTARVNGQLEVLKVEIDPQAVDRRDVEMLQDLIASAINQAMARAQQMMQEEMKGLAGGMQLASLFGAGPTRPSG